MKVIIAPAACSDIEAILEWTHDNFGPQIVEKNSNLIETANQRSRGIPDLSRQRRATRNRRELPHVIP
jgi:plasmid stabilization system protein ParE